MDRRKLPVLFSLSAGAVSLIFSMIKNYSLFTRTWILLLSIIIFSALGSALQWLLDYFDKVNEKQKQIEGKMVEKSTEENKEEKKEEKK